MDVDSLATSPDTSMGLQIMQIPMGATIACVYDPIFVDSLTRKKSYILDWGRQKTNQNMERYISGHKGVDTVFHTFTFPVKEVGPSFVSTQVVEVALATEKLVLHWSTSLVRGSIGRFLATGRECRFQFVQC